VYICLPLVANFTVAHENRTISIFKRSGGFLTLNTWHDSWTENQTECPTVK